MDLKKVLKDFEDAHDALEAAKQAVKTAQELYDKLRMEDVPDALAAAGILDENGKGSCTTPSGRKVYMSTDVRAYIPQADREEAHAALTALGFGELITEQVHVSTLTAWAKGRLEAGEEIPAGITMYSQDRAALRKA